MKAKVNQVGERKHLPLIYLLEQAHGWFEEGLLDAFNADRDNPLSSADIKLLANLNDGVNYSYEVANRLGVSKQAVAKSVKRLVAAELVRFETVPERRTTKRIVMTGDAKRLIRKVSAQLDELEKLLSERIGADQVQALRNALADDWGKPS